VNRNQGTPVPAKVNPSANAKRFNANAGRLTMDVAKTNHAPHNNVILTGKIALEKQK